jgi:Ca2+-binding RTX toxin-like protein
MTVVTISKHQDTTYEIYTSGNTWNFTRAALIQGDAYGIDGGLASNTTISLDGLAFANGAGSYGIVNATDQFHLTVGSTGLVLGNIGVLSRGADNVIVNNGQIVGRHSYAIEIDGRATTIQNDGVIRSGFISLAAYADDVRITNGADGEITGGNTGVALFEGNGGKSRLVNHGLIQGETYAIDAGFGSEVISNRGIIKGPIDLGNGKDFFDTRGGKIDGDVSGGVGDDIFVTDNAHYKLVEIEGQGEDIVRSTVSYRLSGTSFVERLELIGAHNINATGTNRGDQLWGNAGNNRLNGLDGIDTLDGKSGNDMLNGGAGADRFVFKTRYDHDTIHAFEHGIDKIYLGGWQAVNTFAEVKSHAHNDGNALVIEAGHDSLTINGMHKADLVATDFNFTLL